MKKTQFKFIFKVFVKALYESTAVLITGDKQIKQ